MAEENDVAGAPAASPARTPDTSAAAERVTLAEYADNIAGKTKDMVFVKAKMGYQVDPTDRSIPRVTEAGLPMTQEQYEALRDEAGDFLNPRIEEMRG